MIPLVLKPLFHRHFAHLPALNTLLTGLLFVSIQCASVSAQLLDESAIDTNVPTGSFAATSRYGEPLVFQFRVGAIVTAKNGACRDIQAMVAVPIECPEQSVKLVNQELSSQVAPLGSRELQGGAAKQMLISIPYLKAGEEAKAILTFEITSRPTLDVPPAMANTLVIPRRVPKDLRRFVGPSPFIEAKSPKIKKMMRQIDADLESNLGAAEITDWQRIEAYYDHMLDTIDYAEGPDTTALDTLRDEIADCHGRSALFVALCRAAGVPARMVWVHEHCYAEFYLEDPDENGHWFPAESAGTRAFGAMPLVRDVPLYRAILQKGDNFRVPERPRDRLRYATDYLTGKPVPGSGKPSVRYIRELVE